MSISSLWHASVVARRDGLLGRECGWGDSNSHAVASGRFCIPPRLSPPSNALLAALEVRRLDFLFTMSQAFAWLLGERRQVSTPSSSEHSQERPTRLGTGLASLRKKKILPLERKAFPVFDACSPRGFPRGDPYLLFSSLEACGLPRGQGNERRVCCVYRFRHSRSRESIVAQRHCKRNNNRRC